MLRTTMCAILFKFQRPYPLPALERWAAGWHRNTEKIHTKKHHMSSKWTLVLINSLELLLLSHFGKRLDAFLYIYFLWQLLTVSQKIEVRKWKCECCSCMQPQRFRLSTGKGNSNITRALGPSFPLHPDCSTATLCRETIGEMQTSAFPLHNRRVKCFAALCVIRRGKRSGDSNKTNTIR